MSKTAVNKILFITLSNIGDVILTLPILDYLKDIFPNTKITVMVGPRAKEIFEDNPLISKLIVYDKHSTLKEKIKLFYHLAAEHFDMVIDLRNTFYGLFVPAKFRSAPFMAVPEILKHKKHHNLYQMLKFSNRRQWLTDFTSGKMLAFSRLDQQFIDNILRWNNIAAGDKIVVMAPGARSDIKRWPRNNFLELARELKNEPGVRIILVGDKADMPASTYISSGLSSSAIDLTGKTTLRQLGYLLKRSSLVITNDSAIGHLASYVNTPVLSIFGPTNELKYGPWSKVYTVVSRGVFCRPCEKAQCRFGTLECMKKVKVHDVLKEARFLLSNKRRISEPLLEQPFRRILISRTDRIGDVILSTPVVKALRQAYPNAYIAMVVSPAAKDVVNNNPDLDEVMVYDKDKKHRSLISSWHFRNHLKKKDFDLAVLLHPTNRMHLLAFFAGIKHRLGYDRKFGFLLNRRIAHTKQHGLKHESEYNLDLITHLGVFSKDKKPVIHLRKESELWVEALFRRKGIKHSDRILAINPAASCPSKIWPAKRFAEVADELAKKYGLKVLIISGPNDAKIAQEVELAMQTPVLNLAGMTTVAQLISVLKRCKLFISNDSGPVHIASSVGTPVISIFGRNQAGLSPVRWGPLGDKDRYLHKNVGCVECLAHNCIKEFACLKAITVDDVLKTAEEILTGA